MQDGLLGGLGRGLEQAVQRRLMQQRQRRHGFGGPLGQPHRGAEGQRDVAAAVAIVAAGAGQPGRRTTCHAGELAGIQRCIGGQQHDDGAALGGGRLRRPARQLHRHRDALPGHRQRARPPLVGQHQRTQRVAAALPAHAARGAADATLQPVAGHAPPRAHAAFVEAAAVLPRGGQRLQHMGLLQRQRLRIVEPAVVAFEDQRIHRRQAARQLGRVGDGIAHQGGEGGAHGQGAHKRDGRLQRAQLLHLHQARALAEAVDHRHAGRQLLQEQVARLRQQHGGAGLHRAVGQRAMGHRDPCRVGDGIPRAAGQRAHLRRAQPAAGRGAAGLRRGRAWGRVHRAGRRPAG